MKSDEHEEKFRWLENCVLMVAFNHHHQPASAAEGDKSQIKRGESLQL
jgi:hypothetical protein